MMSNPSSEQTPGPALRSLEWFPQVPVTANPVAGALVKTGIGVAVGLIVAFVFGYRVMGLVIVAVAVIIGAASLASHGTRRMIDAGFIRLGEGLGLAVSWLLLAPIFIIGFTMVRGWMWLTKSDPLQISAPAGTATYWLQSDSPERKLRYSGAMFATETRQRRGLGVAAIGALAVAAVLCSEGILRLAGFGDPVLYVDDEQIGYFPRPNQRVTRSGGLVEINAFGMRAPNYPLKKPPGVFRVLMIGDSTLYGGSYVDQSELYSRMLETRLRAKADGRRVEVLAMGVNAWGPFHQLAYIRRFGNFDADLVTINIPTGDIYRYLLRLGETPFISAQNPPRLALEEVAINMAWRYRGYSIGPETEAQHAARRSQGLAAYAQLVGDLRAKGSEVQIYILPNRTTGLGLREPAAQDRSSQERRDAADLRIAAGSGVEVDYPPGLFAGVGEAAYHDDGHLDVAGHAHYAGYLADKIAARSLTWRAWQQAAPRKPT